MIDGSREVRRAIDAGVKLRELFVTEGFWASNIAAAWRSRLGDARVSLVADELLDRICYGDRNEGVVAVAAPPLISLDQIEVPTDALVMVLEGVEKPGNVGAVIRSADAVGAHAVVVVDGGTDLFNPNAIRASLGTIFAMPVCSAAVDETQVWLKHAALQVVVARVDGALWYDQVDYCRGSAIVLGSEAAGVTSSWKSETFIGAKLPMEGVADSLNVSATAAVFCYEANRQRRSAPIS